MIGLCSLPLSTANNVSSSPVFVGRWTLQLSMYLKSLVSIAEAQCIIFIHTLINSHSPHILSGTDLIQCSPVIPAVLWSLCLFSVGVLI